MSEMKRLNPCPNCGGTVTLYSHCNPSVPYHVSAECKECKKVFSLPNVKLKLVVSKAMIDKAENEWNKGNYQEVV